METEWKVGITKLLADDWMANGTSVMTLTSK